LDNAGKTSLLNDIRRKFNLPTAEPVMPTIGQNFSKFDYNGIVFTIWDLGGQEKFRDSWNHYYEEIDALIYVIDSYDDERYKESRKEIKKLVSSKGLVNCPIVFCANKQDVDGAIGPGEILTILKLDNLIVGDRKWIILPTVSSGKLDRTDIDKIFIWLNDAWKNDTNAKLRLQWRKTITMQRKKEREENN